VLANDLGKSASDGVDNTDSKRLDPGKSEASKWRLACEAAQHENDSQKLGSLLEVAETAIFMRWQELDTNAVAEREAIAAATKFLRQLQVKKLNFPPWKGESF
jgi:hypothetical protein